MPLTDWHLIYVNSINGETSFSLENLNNDISLQELLIQTVIKRILTIPGTDSKYPYIGSNIGNIFGTMNTEEVSQIKAMFPIFLKSIEEDIIEEQELLDIALEPEEKLKSLKLQSIVFDEAALGWIVSIVVKTEANSETIITL